MSLTFRWLGTAGIELTAADQVLALDPFFTRPSVRQMFRPIIPDPALVASHLPRCNYVLVNPFVKELTVMDAHNLAYADATFDCVVGQFVITLVEDPERVLS